MEQKTTAELNHEIRVANDIEDFLTKNAGQLLECRLPEHLNRLLEQKGKRKADVVRGSLLDRGYGYQIFAGEKTPSRDKLIALAFGLRLSAEETQKMLKLSGNRELYPRDKRDALILFAIQHGKDINDANERLIDYGFAPLGVARE